MGSRQKIFMNGVQVLNLFSLRLWLPSVWVSIGRNTEEAGCFSECMSANVSLGFMVYTRGSFGGWGKYTTTVCATWRPTTGIRPVNGPEDSSRSHGSYCNSTAPPPPHWSTPSISCQPSHYVLEVWNWPWQCWPAYATNKSPLGA